MTGATLQGHLIPVALILARIIPITFFCPLFGGMAVPGTVRLSVALALAACIRGAGRVGQDFGNQSSSSLLAGGIKELCLGTAMGLLASLPFDAARIGGRFLDLFRGATAEAAMPGIGSRDSASAEGFHRWMVTLVTASALYPLLLGSVLRSFRWLPLGTFGLGEHVALEVARLVGVSLATGLAIGAPVAGLSLAIDVFFGLVSRLAPELRLTELATPLRILGGASLMWLGLGVLAEQFLFQFGQQMEILRELLSSL